MAMTDSELENIAQEMVDLSVAQQFAAELVKNAAIERNRSRCPHCASYHTARYVGVSGAYKCKNCGTFFAENFKHVFPEWARSRKAHFRRWLCLKLNIQAKEVSAQ